MFSLYLELGFEHITDINGYDHILFLMTIVSIYLIKDWKKVLTLITAFTIGHSISLALATFKLVQVNSNLIEFLIPVTILISAVYNLINKTNTKNKQILKYIIAMFFGLIHGLGFSNYLQTLLGTNQNIISSLFAFNLGLEMGQIAIVIIYLSTVSILVKTTKVPLKYITFFVASITIIVSLYLIYERSIF